MTSQKFVAFMEKLLERTKAGQIKWERYSEFSTWASSQKSFSCVIGTMSVTILSSEDLEMIEFVIKYDSSMPATSLDVEADEEQRIAKRLVNYLYDLFPNLEKSIDKFLTEF